MSLVVSLRVPDGIVVAADSISTAQNIFRFIAESPGIVCPSCKNPIKGEEIPLPPIPIPFSASSYTQKLFPLFDEYAISSFGHGIINNKSILYHVNYFERTKSKPKTLKDLVRAFIEYIEDELGKEFPDYKTEAPKNIYPVSFHINGFEKVSNDLVGVTYLARIGRNNKIDRSDKIGCNTGGDTKVVAQLWKIGEENSRLKFKYGLFSLQDAIDLSEFLISTTSTFQRFANELSTVGGYVDIALLTPFDGFQWIKQKEIMKILEERKWERRLILMMKSAKQTDLKNQT